MINIIVIEKIVNTFKTLGIIWFALGCFTYISMFVLMIRRRLKSKNINSLQKLSRLSIIWGIVFVVLSWLLKSK